MVNTRSLVLGRMANVREDLEEAIGRLDDGMMNWAPTAGMRTVAGLLVEIAGTEVQIMSRLRRSHWPSDDEVRERIGDLESLDVLRRFVRDVRDQTLSYINGLSDEELDAEAEFRLGWSAPYDLPWFPRAEIFRKIAEHESYHVGQLFTYIWAHGDNPYEWDAR